ncbi:hypothetical protein CTAYLR_002730 [Chrysophaeum taylorii]|uniref:Tudor domain-containing protein n=1 Tax=Chrysophaeum taylorii TaxID=2483200 RepID=A0AAD7UD08_9STRA|nr:hypothetical protein CTAYLR_002730 [Chrysophaeum taylorii]
MSEELKQKLATYGEQLGQVEALLASDPSNEQFIRLKQDLVEVTKLTEDLLKFKASEAQRQEASEKVEHVEVSAFEVGMRCEAVYQEKWYPAVITGMSGGRYTVVFIGFGNSEVLDAAGVRPLHAEHESLDPASLTAGFECLARYSGDGQFYEVVIEEVTDFGYKVMFVDYGDSEEVPLEYLRARDAAKSDARELTRAPDGSYHIPDYLRLQPTDTEPERQRKRRKVKALKQQVKSKEQDEEREGKKSTWQAFQSRGAKKKVLGSMKAVRKESIFVSPDTVDGKVGVTGSGKGITEYGERKKFKFREPPDLR